MKVKVKFKNDFFEVLENVEISRCGNLEQIEQKVSLSEEIVNFLEKYSDCCFQGENFAFTVFNLYNSSIEYEEEFSGVIDNCFPIALNDSHHYLAYYSGCKNFKTGIYLVDMGDIDLEEMIFICNNIENLFKGEGIEVLSQA